MTPASFWDIWRLSVNIKMNNGMTVICGAVSITLIVLFVRVCIDVHKIAKRLENDD